MRVAMLAGPAMHVATLKHSMTSKLLCDAQIHYKKIGFGCLSLGLFQARSKEAICAAIRASATATSGHGASGS